MTRSLEDEVAYAMETPATLLPHLAYLLQDLPSLSGTEVDAVELLQEVGFPTGGTILDLGCGRGDIAIRLARVFDAQVTGVDAHAPFVEIARQSAVQAGQDGRCRFVAADLRQALSASTRFDAVLMFALGSVLGDAAETVAQLRAVARDGGYIIIDEAFRADGDDAARAHPDYPDWRTLEAELTRFGDSIAARRIRSPDAQAFNALTLQAVPKRAAELTAAHPALKDDLDRYVARQFEEVAWMEDPLLYPVVLAIRKSAA